jgi:MFS family permease
MLVPGFLLSSLVPAVILFTVAGVALGAANPAIDAARLDIMPSWLWGRAESVRTVLRTAGEAVAPVTFGAFAGWFAGPSEQGLQVTFLVMLVPLALSGVVLWRARRSYPDDAVAASADDEREAI